MLRLANISLLVLFFSVAVAQQPVESVDGTGLNSVDGTGTDSVDGTGLESVDGTGTDSVDGTGLESVDGTGTDSVDGTGLDAVVSTPGGSSNYVVEEGDTLGSIAMRFFGDSSQWKQIFAANSGLLSDANTIPAGITLTIPPAN